MRFPAVFNFFLLLVVSLPMRSEAAAEPIYIGIDADFSAVAVEGGVAIKRGVELAVKEINSNGGMLGRKVHIIAKDHRGNPARGRHNIQRFATTANLVAVVGGVHTPVALEELADVHDNNLLFLIPWAAGTAVIDNGYSPNNVFRVSVRDAEAGEVLIRSAKSRGITKVALILERTGWGRSNETSLIANAAAQGIEITSTHWINWQQKAFKEDISALKLQQAEGIVMVTNAPEGAVVINELAAQELLSLPVFSHWGIASGNFISRLNVSPEQLNLAVLQTFHFNYQQHSKSQQLLEAYHREYGLIAPEAIPAVVGLAHAYDLTHLLALAVENAGSTNPDDVRLALETLDAYKGALKHYKPAFTQQRHDALLAKDYFMAKFDNKGNLVVLENQ